MNIHIPVFGTTKYYKKDYLVEYNGQVYVCDNPNATGNFNRSDWHHAIVDIHIEHSITDGFNIQCVLVPDNFELMSFCEFSGDSIVGMLLDAVQNISDRFSIRNIYLDRYSTSCIRTILTDMGYNVLFGPHNGETYIDRVVRITKEKSGLKDDENLVRLYALLALVKGDNVTLEDVHDAWAMDMNFKKKNHPYCYGHDHKSIVPFDQLSVETQERDRDYMEAIKEVANTISK